MNTATTTPATETLTLAQAEELCRELFRVNAQTGKTEIFGAVAPGSWGNGHRVLFTGAPSGPAEVALPATREAVLEAWKAYCGARFAPPVGARTFHEFGRMGRVLSVGPKNAKVRITRKNGDVVEKAVFLGQLRWTTY